MTILDIPRTVRRQMMRAQLREREKAIRAGAPNPPDVPDLRLRGNMNPEKHHSKELRYRVPACPSGFAPADLAVKGAAARRAAPAQA